MAEAESNKTLWVAVAGIAATALVGLAGTTTAWLSARDDRATQRQLARDEHAHQRALARDDRTYQRRLSVYLDAVDFVEAQERAFCLYGALAHSAGVGGSKTLPAHFPEPSSIGGNRILSYRLRPPQRLNTLLRIFGSKRAFESFHKIEKV